jgi:hypothetical protein
MLRRVALSCATNYRESVIARRLATLLTVILPLLAPGAILAAPTYAGMTKAVAVAKARTAEYAALAVGVSIGTVSASQAKALRHQVATETPKVLKGRCDGRQAWKVIWRKSTPILVGKGVGPKPATLCS